MQVKITTEQSFLNIHRSESRFEQFQDLCLFFALFEMLPFCSTHAFNHRRNLSTSRLKEDSNRQEIDEQSSYRDLCRWTRIGDGGKKHLEGSTDLGNSRERLIGLKEVSDVIHSCLKNECTRMRDRLCSPLFCSDSSSHRCTSLSSSRSSVSKKVTFIEEGLQRCTVSSPERQGVVDLTARRQSSTLITDCLSLVLMNMKQRNEPCPMDMPVDSTASTERALPGHSDDFWISTRDKTECFSFSPYQDLLTCLASSTSVKAFRQEVNVDSEAYRKGQRSSSVNPRRPTTYVMKSLNE